MTIVGITHVRCTGCSAEHECELVQSINTRGAPAHKQRLLRGELNVLDCTCGKRIQLSANLLYHDPDADFLCHVCPGGPDAIARAIDAFRSAGATGTSRIVPSLNALVEKVKLLDAGLEDWAIEMIKVLLLASITEPSDTAGLDRVLLFEAVDRDAQLLRWVLFDRAGAPSVLSSPLAAYTNLAAQTHVRPHRDELEIDRAWGLDAVRTMIASGN